MIEFWFLAVALIASAIFTISAKRPVYSVVGLLAHFVALAVTFLSLQAEFMGVIQIVVYSGAILILFVFVIALLSSGVRPFDVGPDRMSRATLPVAIVFAAVCLAAIGATEVHAPIAAQAAAGATGDANAFGSVADFGVALFTKNLLPFEVTAFILMVSVVGVVLIAGDDEPSRRRKVRRSAEREAIWREDREVALRQAQGDKK